MSSHQPRHRGEDRVEVGGPIFCDQGKRFRLARRFAEQENDFGHAIGLELEPGLQGAARIEPGANSIGERRAASQRRPDRRELPLRPRNSVRSPVHEVCWPLKSANATRPP